MKLTTGIELEGPHKGLTTLFVHGYVPTEDIAAAIEAAPDIAHVYFGAGRRTRINVRSVKAIVERFIDLKVTVEFNAIQCPSFAKYYQEFPNSVYWIIPLVAFDHSLLADYNGSQYISLRKNIGERLEEAIRYSIIKSLPRVWAKVETLKWVFTFKVDGNATWAAWTHYDYDFEAKK